MATALRDVAIFDISKEKFKHLERLPDFPFKIVESLCKSINEVIERGTKLRFSRKRFSNNDLSNHWIVSSLKIRRSFLMMHIKLLGNYLKFIQPETNQFNYDKYISQCSPFVKFLANTAHFKSFIEDILKCPNEVYLFIEATKLYGMKGEEILENELENAQSIMTKNYINV